MDENNGHRAWRMGIIIAHVAVLILTIVFNFLSGTGQASSGGIYESNTGNVSDRYGTKITPAGWTFSIWGFIYTWQVIHAIYSLTLLCRKTNDGQYLYISPGHLHFSFYIVYMVNNCLNTAWIFLFDRAGSRPMLLIPCMIDLWLITFTLYVCGVLVCRYMDQAGADLEKAGQAKDIWLTRILVLNGLAFYGTWCTIASLLNFCIVLQHNAGVNEYTCAWIALGILTAELVIWFILETFVFDRYIRYCFSPYIVLVIALSGLLSKHHNSDSPETYTLYVLALLALSAALGVAKVVVMVVRGLKHPIKYPSDIQPTTKQIEAQNTPL